MIDSFFVERITGTVTSHAKGCKTTGQPDTSFTSRLAAADHELLPSVLGMNDVDRAAGV